MEEIEPLDYILTSSRLPFHKYFVCRKIKAKKIQGGPHMASGRLTNVGTDSYHHLLRAEKKFRDHHRGCSPILDR